MRTSIILLSGLLGSLIDAYVYQERQGLGIGYQQESAQLFQQANTDPDVTRELTFNLSLQTNEFQGDMTWRINVSNVAVPNATNEFPGEQGPVGEDPHVVNTVYSFDFANDSPLGGLHNGTEGTSQPFCLTFINPLPQSLMDKFEHNDSGDCSSMIGVRCLQAMYDSPWSGDVGTCSPPSWNLVDECEDLLTGGPYSAVTTNLYSTRDPRSSSGDSDPASNDTTGGERRGLSSGEAVYFAASDAYAAANTTAYEEELGRVQMVYLYAAQDRAVCMRMRPREATATEDGAGGDGGSGTDTGESPSSTESGAAVYRSAWVLLAAGVAGSVMISL